MNTITKIAVALGVCIVGGNLVFRYVLNDDQRNEIRAANKELTDALREVEDTISPLVSDGPTRAEERAAAEANRARTKQQWAAIGY